jgi:hypothetical protein
VFSVEGGERCQSGLDFRGCKEWAVELEKRRGRLG